MEIQEVIDIVKKANQKCPQEWFSGKTKGCTYFKVRLILTEDGHILTNKRGSIDKREEVDPSDWLTIRPSFQNKTQLFRSNVHRILEYLDSGLWPEYISQLNRFFDVTDNELEKMREESVKKQREFLDSLGVTLLTTQMFRGLLTERRFIKSVFFGKGNTETKKQLLDAIREKKEFHAEWRTSYDCTLHYDPNESKAFYTELYRGQNFGHYYILLDEMHATFVKDK